MPSQTVPTHPDMVSGHASAADLVRRLRAREVSPRELAEEHLRRIENHPELGSFLFADRDRLLAQIPDGPGSGPLAGLPLALKDNIDTKGVPTSSGSMADWGRIPDHDAAVWTQLRDRAGARLLGKTHMSEFAYRCHHPELGVVHNPHQLSRATGGSSSGSAAAVAAGLAPAALGTDTGGSIRIPASYCGVVGLKGGTGEVSTAGVVPLSLTLDHVGVLARSVADAALVYQEMMSAPIQLVDPVTLEVPGAERPRLRIGVDRGYFTTEAQPAVLGALNNSLRILESTGCRVVEVNLAGAGTWRRAQRQILLREAWLYHRDRLAGPAPYGPVFRASVAKGAEITPPQYDAALKLRRTAMRFMADVFTQVDLIVAPTCPTVAHAGEEGLHGTAYTRYASLAAFTGLPALSLPAGRGYLGLPVGIQVIGASGATRTVVTLSALLESALGAW
ncbi:MAG TPA: amidase [Candidatus Acidoferrales bacterium]|nr:amidase [Candidatus Acidoferrales bacterium]